MSAIARRAHAALLWPGGSRALRARALGALEARLAVAGTFLVVVLTARCRDAGDMSEVSPGNTWADQQRGGVPVHEKSNSSSGRWSLTGLQRSSFVKKGWSSS